MVTISLELARRTALSAIGLAGPRPEHGRRRDARHFRRVLRSVDVVQIDSVNVLARAHELPFWSRLGPHSRKARDRWLWRSREAFEGWIHAASLTQIEVWPLLHHRRCETKPWARVRRIEEEMPGYLEAVRREVESHVPVSVRNLTDPGQRTGPWWGNPRGKVALEYLVHTGELAVDHRTPAFVTVYDLAERIIPSYLRTSEPPPREVAERALLLRAARAHGLGTAHDLADHHRLPVGRARTHLDQLVVSGDLEEVRVEGWGDVPVYLDPSVRVARRILSRTLVSPFDPLIWNRDRVERLFGFRYRLEMYLPEDKRRFGYYVLPFLLEDRLVARVDLKADRAERVLRVRGAFSEPGADRTHVAGELSNELRDLGKWLELSSIQVHRNGNLATHLIRSTQ